MCATCGGDVSGLPLHQCPTALLAACREVAQVRNATDLLQLGILPAGGGWHDQAATFVDACTLLLAMRSRLEAKRAKRPGGA